MNRITTKSRSRAAVGKLPIEAPSQTGKSASFEELKGSNGFTLSICRKPSDYCESIRLAADANVSLLTYYQAIQTISEDAAIKEALKGTCFYLAEAGVEKSGWFVMNTRGNLVELNELISPELTIFAWKGKNQQMLAVNSDKHTSRYSLRFELIGYARLDTIADVVVGLPNSNPQLDLLRT